MPDEPIPLPCTKCRYVAMYTPPDDFVDALDMYGKCAELTPRIDSGEVVGPDPRRCNAIYQAWVKAEHARKARPLP
jgi:hypothetical protein